MGAGAVLAQDITVVGSALMLALGAIALVAPQCCQRRRSTRAAKLVRAGSLGAAVGQAGKRVRIMAKQGGGYDQLSRVEESSTRVAGVDKDVTTVEL